MASIINAPPIVLTLDKSTQVQLLTVAEARIPRRRHRPREDRREDVGVGVVANILADICPLGMRACTCVNVYCTR